MEETLYVIKINENYLTTIYSSSTSESSNVDNAMKLSKDEIDGILRITKRFNKTSRVNVYKIVRTIELVEDL